MTIASRAILVMLMYSVVIQLSMVLYSVPYGDAAQVQLQILPVKLHLAHKLRQAAALKLHLWKLH